MSDFKNLIRDLRKCSSIVNKPWSIEPDADDDTHTYNGVIVGGSETQIWGCIFHFTLYIDEEKMNDPPRVTFSPGLFHPFIEPIYGDFCYPQDLFELSSRMSMEEFLDDLYSLFMLEKPFSHSINTEAAATFNSSPSKFWAILRQKSFISILPQESSQNE